MGELQELKNKIRDLLEQGNEAEADRVHAANSQLKWFYPTDTYHKHKHDQRRHFQNQITQAAKQADLGRCAEIRDSRCRSWLTDEQFRALVLKGLVTGKHWSAVCAFATRSEICDLTTPAILANAIAVDVESDGETIWEIGTAANNSKQLLLSRIDAPDKLQGALGELKAQVDAKRIIIGHNILAWDWPILARRINAERTPLIWDTLLVQYLLEPQVASHALGGNHRAHDDALNTAKLFERQIQQLPASIALALHADDFADTSQLMDAIVKALEGQVTYARAEAPDWLSNATGPEGQVLLVPEHQVRAADWVPDLTVIAANPAEELPAPWRELDVAALERNLADTGDSGPAARTLLGVARLAAAQRIAVRRCMIPLWLLEGGSRFTSAVDAACTVPDRPLRLRIAAFPTCVNWWAARSPATHPVACATNDTLVLDRRPFSAIDITGSPGILPPAALIRLGDPGRVSRWVLRDRAADVLEPRGGLCAFTTLLLSDPPKSLSQGRPALRWRPCIATRRHHVLYAGANDQAAYWMEVLRTFREVAKPDATTVPILLVGSSRSRSLVDLLTTGLAELGLGEVKLDHRSSREHLLRASRNGHALVDTIERWPSWQALAQPAGIVLQPVVESLPIEEWHACAETRQASREPFNTGSLVSPVDPNDEVIAVPTATVLEKTHLLVDAELHGWLFDVGLSKAQVPVLLTDPRIGAIANGLSRIADVHPLHERPLQAEESERLAIALSVFTLKRDEAPSTVDAMEAFLVANWQPPKGRHGDRVSGFKASQREAIEAICDRSANVLVSLPTGEGKSVLFQVPALCRGLRNRRLTLVLSPLKALMRDQVERLREQGFAGSADFLSSDRSVHEIAEVIQGLLDHRIVLLYVAPERLRSEVFLEVLSKRMRADGGLEHIVIDETHCVNQWGYEFRPDYFHALNLLLRKCQLVDTAKPTMFVLLSATVTASDRACLSAILSGTAGAVGSPLPLKVIPEAFANPLRAHIAVETKRVRGHLSDSREFQNALTERMLSINDAVRKARKNRLETEQRSAVLVFVSSRRHAEIVAQRLAEVGGANVDYYHAGLDAVTREETYTRFLDGELDVLVATKAFGMGMDIPDIHWVIHLSPPSYLEDFLQEVGRIGRGVTERKKARLDKLSATLLYSDRDFESIRDLRARNALSATVLNDLLQEVTKYANEIAGQQVAIVPSEGFASQNPPPTTESARRAAATRVRMTLYWLERAGRLKLQGSIPDLIVLTIEVLKLHALSRKKGPAAEVAALILELAESEGVRETRKPGKVSAEQQAADIDGAVIGSGTATKREINPPGGGPIEGLVDTVGRLLGGLMDNLGVVFGNHRESRASSRATTGRSSGAPLRAATQPPKTLALNLSQVKLRSDAFKSIGDVLAAIAELENQGGVSLQREIPVVLRRLAKEPHTVIAALFNYVDRAAAELLRRLAANGKLRFSPHEMVEDVAPLEVTDEKARPQFHRAFINGFRSLARSAGVRLRQVAREDGKVLWEANLAPSASRKADLRRQKIRRGAQSVFETIAGRPSVPMSSLIESLRTEHPERKFSERDFREVSALLAAMNLISISEDLVPLSHIVLLSGAQGDLAVDGDVLDELNEVNDLAEARNLAMEVFTNIREDAREGFIEGYFATSAGPELRRYLESQLGEIEYEGDGEGGSGAIVEMREKLRRTKAVEFFERFKSSEEQSQWGVVQVPFDQHALVNAGPGAGKTFVLVGRIVHLIREQKIDPSQIVVLAFNRAVVFEIRRRIRELFKSLGYAVYASRLRVSTFHAFALKHLALHGGSDIGLLKSDDVLRVFNSRMEDSVFRRAVAGNVRCILIDEFQDATDDVYAVVKNLHLGSDARAGVMAIGDDDQDILRWQRRKSGNSGHEFSEEYFTRFESEFSGGNLRRFVLGTNFRSGRAIVEVSQRLISKYFDSRTRSRRIKTAPLMPRRHAVEGICERIDWRGRSWPDAIDRAAALLEELKLHPSESIAVLCRSNAEVAEAHRRLIPTQSRLAVQGSDTLRVANLRHVGMWLDFLSKVAALDDRILSGALKDDLLERFSREVKIPEIARPETVQVRLDVLWELCCQEQPFPHLSSLIRFISELESDNLLRMTGDGGTEAPAVVSTLHKVKGLEFDNVVILPSFARFGRPEGSGSSHDLDGDAAEEARLLYVGMTRAKKRLIYFVGDRERSWVAGNPQFFEGQAVEGRFLTGSMKDVALGWAMQLNRFNSSPRDCQRYIETEVAVGDRITLGGVGMGAGKALMHCSSSGKATQIGFLAERHGAGVAGAILKVSAVVRFRPNEFDHSIDETIRAQGWGYAVLVTGRLR